jgi:hypothetical protein
MLTSRRLFTFSFAAAAATAFTTPDAAACSCMAFATPEEHLAYADVVFRGQMACTLTPASARAAEGGLDALERITRFDVLDVYKADAPLGAQIEVHHHANECCICGVDFGLGATPLLLADRNEAGQLWTSYCMRPWFPERAYRRALGLL